MKKIVIGLILALSLVGCAGLPGVLGKPTPAQVVYVAKTDYAAALTVAVAYKKLPLCVPAVEGTPKQLLCSKAEVVLQLRKADDAADAALDAAESVVRTPGFGKDIVDSALASVKAATAALTSITATLGVK